MKTVNATIADGETTINLVMNEREDSGWLHTDHIKDLTVKEAKELVKDLKWAIKQQTT